jgi:hypothetical protein
MSFMERKKLDKKMKKFMEGVSHNPHMHAHGSGRVVAHQRTHYGSGHMSDYHSSIKDMKSRLEKRESKKSGGHMPNLSATARVF